MKCSLRSIALLPTRFGATGSYNLVQTGNAWYSNQEHGRDAAISPLKDFRSKPGAAFAIGKWFTPGIGLRTKIQGIWGKRVGADSNPASQLDNSNKYWIAQEQVMFNLSNLLCGYNENRVWNLIPFAGAGVGRSMSANRYAMGLSAGLQIFLEGEQGNACLS